MLETCFTRGGWRQTQLIAQFILSGACSNARPGWPNVPVLRATDQGTREHLAEQIQMFAINDVTNVPWGEWDHLTVFRKPVKDGFQFVPPRNTHLLGT